MGVEVVACGEAEVPVFGGTDVAGEAEVLGYFAVILHFAFVEVGCLRLLKPDFS